MLKPELPKLNKAQDDLIRLALAHFQVEEKPAYEMLTPSQKVMFYYLISGDKHRIQIIASTQYGKSLVVALACLFLSCIDGILVAVVAPSTDKAKIIMRYYIEHLGDHSRLLAKLQRDTKLDRLRKEESKERILLNNGGGIFVISAQERNAMKSIESAMGYGSFYVIGDEYCLVNDNTEATIFRMIAGKGAKATYVKIGNPFNSAEPYSHFKKSWEGGKYERVFIDENVGLKEGRYTKDFLDEARTKPLYSILFKCEFPPLDEMGRDGYRQLLLPNQANFKTREEVLKLFKELQADEIATGVNPSKIKLGIDIGGGGDKSVFVLRKKHLAFEVATLNTRDTMVNVTKTIELIEEFKLLPENIAIDDIGIGRGVCDRLIELGYGINSVSVGMPANDSNTFANIKAELHWRMKDWVLDKGTIEDNADFNQIFWTKWKVQTGEKKIILEPKEHIRQRHKKSPDYNDALVLTFYEPPFIGFL